MQRLQDEERAMAFTPGQERCINTFDRSLVVAAGAGSGKTFTLTKRIVHAIQSGVVDGIERVCAITFTNKAAGELKSRIKSELRACGLAEQALKVDEAWVSTIHGMCARILRAHAIELDIDPKFKMIDAVLAQRLQKRAVDAVLRTVNLGEDGQMEGWPARAAVDELFAEYPARSYMPRTTSVESMLNRLMDAASGNLNGFDAFVMPRVSTNPLPSIHAVLDAYEALAEATYGQKKNDAREAFAAEAERRVPEIRSQLGGPVASDLPTVLKLLDSLPTPKKTGTADYKAQAGEALDLFRACVMELRLAIAVSCLETLVALARQAYALFMAAKREEGVLDNNDLLVLASRAIAEHPEIAAQYTDKFQLVMVDEFQDTDQMQVDMIKKLAWPGACRLCTVGDAQQSIYRFRGADVSVYRRHLESVRGSNPADVIMLPDNFRSHPDVLALVDRVFEQPEMFGGGFMSLKPGRDESRVKKPFEADIPRVQVLLTSKPYSGVTIDQAREVAAARIADVFASLHDRGHSAGEMAVLLGGMTHADVYAAAMRARGLACVIAGGSVFSRCPEAAVVGDLARVVANPYQTQSLFNVLTGPLFELDAGDLLELATMSDSSALRRRNLCKGLMACVREAREGAVPERWSPKLQLAVRVMGALIGGSSRSLVSRVVMRAVVDSGWVSRLQAQGAEGLASAANVYKAIRMIESIEQEQASGPARTAALFQVLLEESNEAPGALSATGGDFVRIMTIHSSKGLEFPIVAVGEIGSPSGDYSKLLACGVEGRVVLSLDLMNSVNALSGSAKLGSLSPLYASLMEDCADEDELLDAVKHARNALEQRAALYMHDFVGDEEEDKRLLYVALTRAKEALVISLIGSRTKDNANGTPNGCLSAVVSALAGDEGFAPGVSRFDYRGTAPALVEHVALDVADNPDDEGDGGAAASAHVDEAAASDELFSVPAPMPWTPVSRTPYAPAHDGVFSYSSIAEASHEGDVLERLAQRFCVSVDAAQDDAFSGYLAGGGLDFFPSASRANRNAAVSDEDDGSWAYTGSISADADKATDLGTAFHRLAQYAVATRSGKGPLVMPAHERVEALCRACHLGAEQRGRLNAALGLWFGSDMAHAMAGFDDLRAEAPFFVSIPFGDGRQAFLEGEIDLLALDGTLAVVVDYKTGGHAGEAPDELRRKHVLQAACYAYAIMLQGVCEVEAVFVRVERSREDDPAQPQCVRYRFEASDVPLLAEAIGGVYAK